jgi:hypothetical protein
MDALYRRAGFLRRLQFHVDMDPADDEDALV